MPFLYSPWSAHFKSISERTVTSGTGPLTTHVSLTSIQLSCVALLTLGLGSVEVQQYLPTFRCLAFDCLQVQAPLQQMAAQASNARSISDLRNMRRSSVASPKIWEGPKNLGGIKMFNSGG